jgi:hypothetical protein
MHPILTLKINCWTLLGTWYLGYVPNFPQYTTSVVCVVGPSVNPIQNSLNM